MKEVQAAARCVTEAADNNGLMMFARMGMMQAINRQKPQEFDPKRKSPHWGNFAPPRHRSEGLPSSVSRIGVGLMEHPREPIRMESVDPGRRAS
jgi:hypothetical protein